MKRPRAEAAIGQLTTSCYRVPTDAPEADGAFAWHGTTLVPCCAKSATWGRRGLAAVDNALWDLKAKLLDSWAG